MNELLAVLTGVIITVMAVMNGELSVLLGNYHATVLIHCVGLAGAVLILLLTGSKLPKPDKKRFFLYTGGMVGVFTTVANIITIVKLDVSLTLALGLFGQLTASFIVDTFGLFGAKAQSYEKNKLFGIGLIAVGIILMLFL